MRDGFVTAFAEEVRRMHGNDVKADRHYVRMVNDKAFERVSGYLKDAELLFGGECDPEERFIGPPLS